MCAVSKQREARSGSRWEVAAKSLRALAWFCLPCPSIKTASPPHSSMYAASLAMSASGAINRRPVLDLRISCGSAPGSGCGLLCLLSVQLSSSSSSVLSTCLPGRGRSRVREALGTVQSTSWTCDILDILGGVRNLGVGCGAERRAGAGAYGLGSFELPRAVVISVDQCRSV